MSKDLVILAQDPSFNKLSFSLYNGEETIYLDSCSFKFSEQVIGFEQVFRANREIAHQYLNKLYKEYKVNTEIFVKKIFSEIPPPTGMYSAGLFSLDTYILDKLFIFNKQCDEVYTLPPSFLMTIHNSRKYKKSDSTAFARYFMNDILKDKFEFIYKNRLNADMAESFLFLLRAFCRFDIKGTRDLIISTIPGFFSEPEKLLIRR